MDFHQSCSERWKNVQRVDARAQIGADGFDGMSCREVKFMTFKQNPPGAQLSNSAMMAVGIRGLLRIAVYGKHAPQLTLNSLHWRYKSCFDSRYIHD